MSLNRTDTRQRAYDKLDPYSGTGLFVDEKTYNRRVENKSTLMGNWVEERALEDSMSQRKDPAAEALRLHDAFRNEEEAAAVQVKATRPPQASVIAVHPSGAKTPFFNEEVDPATSGVKTYKSNQSSAYIIGTHLEDVHVASTHKTDFATPGVRHEQRGVRSAAIDEHILAQASTVAPEETERPSFETTTGAMTGRTGSPSKIPKASSTTSYMSDAPITFYSQNAGRIPKGPGGVANPYAKNTDFTQPIEEYTRSTHR